MNEKNYHGDRIPENFHTIEVHLQDVNKLFDAMDPSPLSSKDLHPNVVARIVDSGREFSFRAPLALVLHVDRPTDALSTSPHNEQVVCDAIRAYFSQLSKQSRHKLRLHLRRGVISLIIGLAVLAAALVGSKLLGEGTIASTIRESLDIGGWVALWRPMEIFLYDWWPLLGDQLFYRRLGKMPVQIQYAN